MRRYDALPDNSDTEYANIPPVTSGYPSNEIRSITTSASSSNLNHLIQQEQELNNRRINHNRNNSVTIPRGDSNIPSYDETMSNDAAARMSVSSSVQSNQEQPIHLINHDEDNNETNKNLLKILGLNFLNARQHLALAICRDCVLILPLYHAFTCFKTTYYLDHNKSTEPNIDIKTLIIEQLISPGSSEHFIAGIWCLVAAYLSFAVLDGLLVRWIVTYQTSAAILRVLSMSLLIITIEQATLAIFSPGGTYSLHTWILISLILTGAYILQTFVTSNLDLKNETKARSVDYYNITVYAVVPVGLASFVSMIALLRALLILRLDVENKEFGSDRMTTWIF